MKKSTKHFLFVATATLTGMYAYNRFVANNATSKNMLPTKNGSYYSWKQGNVFYTKAGSGKPVLLIHDINSMSSSMEWSKIIRRLQKNHTVYAVDLLGCGLSDKPAVSYTVYMYVQMITAFIKDVIKEKTDVVATDLSAPVAIMTNQLDDSVIDKIILINPVSLKLLDRIPDRESKLKQNIINLPLVGTFIYNLLFNPARVDWMFRNTYFSREQLVSDKIKDTYYEAAHIDDSHGKFLYSSVLGNYMNGDIRHAIKKIEKPVYMIISRDIQNNLSATEEYRKLNHHIEVTNISNCKLYPQLENPEKISQIIESILAKK
ncbi:MAG: hypothetical protein NC180_06955 [Muribaculaceae bacterium]|nr:alpha/beta hydrolase [Roseburia sp.]MCM1430031.1 hypothetical protein [Muribaculaceae bacterium]MCM1492942.1 hypothetical protein [Muribaculaceae bacterium]